LTGVQSHCKRFREGELAQRNVAFDREALALTHHEVFAEHSLHMREEARAAEKLHVRAQLLASLATIFAMSTRVRWADGHFVAWLDPGDARAHARDDCGRLVPGDQRLAHDKAAVTAFEVVMQIRSADAGGAKLQQDFAGSCFGQIRFLDAKIVLRVNSTGEHHGLRQ
jgi:hypothetical protein